MLPPRLDELVNALLDGEASERDVSELQSLIDDKTVPEIADRVAEHRLLGLIHQPFDSDMYVCSVMDAIAREERSVANAIIDKIQDSVTHEHVDLTVGASGPRSTRRHVVVGFFVAVAMSLTVVASIWLLERGNDAKTVPIADSSMVKTSIATLLLEENCVWTSEVDLEEGERLRAGPVGLERGTAVLRFDGGAELVMIGPAAINLRSAVRVQVHHGDVVVRATDGAEGFVVLTPTSEVVDLGTEFAVKVNRDGKTEVHVLEGEVSYRKIDAPDELVKILRAGEGVAIHKDGRPVAVPMNAPRFKDYLQRINPRSRTDLLIAYEGFNYSPGLLPLKQSTVGLGWAGPWRKRNAHQRTRPSEDTSPDRLEIVHGQMKVSWPVPGGRMGMLRLADRNAYYLRPLEESIDLDRDGVTFFSLMVREQHSMPHKNSRERLRLTIRSLSDYYSDYISFGHSGHKPQVRTGNGVLFSSPIVTQAGQTTLWVGKIVSRSQGEDEIYFHIYSEEDKLGYAEPATWHVMTKNVESSSRFDCVLLSSEGSTERIVDELRIGPTWRSVAPLAEETK